MENSVPPEGYLESLIAGDLDVGVLIPISSGARSGADPLLMSFPKDIKGTFVVGIQIVALQRHIFITCYEDGWVIELH